MTVFDAVLVGVILVGYPLWDYYVAWPRTRAALAAGRPDARRNAYRSAIITQWTATAIVVAALVASGRSFSTLGLVWPSGWRLAVSLVLVAAALVLVVAQSVGVSRANEEERVGLRPQLGYALPILPRTPRERRWFVALSATAGTCEEVLYRGYLFWALTPFVGAWGAALVSTAGFGIAHAYLGRTGVVRATAVAAVFSVLALTLRTILPLMPLHALIDLGAGLVGYQLLRDQPEENSVQGSFVASR